MVHMGSNQLMLLSYIDVSVSLALSLSLKPINIFLGEG